MSRKKGAVPYENLIRLNWVIFQKWRLGKEFSQNQAAKACRVDPRTWRRLEHGEEVEIVTAVRVAKKLKIPLDHLLRSAK